MPTPEDSAQREEVSQLLKAWADHDPTARDALVPIIYDELRRLAYRQVRHRLLVRGAAGGLAARRAEAERGRYIRTRPGR